MEFAEVREYLRGDDVRTIDWNVTARTGSPYVKVFDEEREQTVMLLVDASASGAFGSVRQMKGEVGVEISALLAFAAIKNNDRVGLLIFTDVVEVFVPPKKRSQARSTRYSRTAVFSAPGQANIHNKRARLFGKGPTSSQRCFPHIGLY